MIINERQYKITKGQLRKLEEALESFNMKKEALRVKSKLLAKSEFEALQSEIENLYTQVQEYETLKSGTVEQFMAATIEDLPTILIKARIAKGFSQNKLANMVGLKEQQIQRYEAEQYATANLARLSQIAKALELNISEIAEFKVSDNLISLNNTDFDWSNFPVKEMYKRNWFQDLFTGSLPAALKNAEELVSEYLGNTLSKSICSAARQRIRSGGLINKYALIAWQCRIIDLARKEKLQKKFNLKMFTDNWFRNLVNLSCQDDGPRKVSKYLYEHGIRLIIQPHLPQTHLDGAAFLLNSGPVIGMTLRYDRLDNFWFVLIHELIHIKKHLHKGKIESIFDDLDAAAEAIEIDADECAAEILISAEKWDIALPRYIHKKDIIKDFANELGINPAIVAGKIRRETENYLILNDMIGQGEVRKHFPNVDFSFN
jgi:HTH-type transcriptional regulator/antitoxin HigA